MQDLATQLFHSKQYTAACKQHNQKKGKYLSLPFAEHLSGMFVKTFKPIVNLLHLLAIWQYWAGVPENWSSPTDLVKKEDVARLCPWVSEPVTKLHDRHNKHVCSIFEVT